MAYRSFSFGYGLTLWVKRLLIANVAVFFLTVLAERGGIPLAGYLAFRPFSILTQPWGLVTYMFVHGGFWHLFFNLLGLFFFGPPLEERWGSREFLKYYLICGLGGAALSFVFAGHSAVVGASAAVFGVMLAFAMNWPDVPIYIWGIFPIPAKYLVGIIGVLTLFSAIGGNQDGVAHFAHLGGFAAGFIYLRFEGPLAARLGRFKKLANRPKLTVLKGGAEPVTPAREARRQHRQEDDRLLDEVDRVLDKISSSGLSSLSAEERRLLDEVSRRFRQN